MRESYAIRVYKQYFNFGSAHFLIFADGSREELHGHNYKVRVRLEGKPTGGDLVVDFIIFKPIVKAICDALDHRTLLPRFNKNLSVTVDDDRVEARHSDGSYFCFPRRDVLVLDVTNTSTEMLARYIGGKILEPLPAKFPGGLLTAIEIEVEESPGQAGICRLELDV